MSERKVLNKYFPPDYDPNKIPRMGRCGRRRQFNIRTMAPFNMRCLTCNGYIYKAKKFNSRMETAENVDYLGLRHYRFFIRCPTCCAEIIWRTDIESGDYVLEGGAKRNFEALKTAEELEAKRQAEEEEELANNPMKMLEKRTDQSKHEMEMVEVIEDLKQLNERQAGMGPDHAIFRTLWQEEEARKKLEEEEDEKLIKELLASRSVPPNPTETVETVVQESPYTDTASTVTSDPVGTTSANPVVPRNQNLSANCKKSYMKRQLQGIVLLKNNQEKATSSQCHQSAKQPASKMSKVSDDCDSGKASLLGISYSDSD